MEPFIPFYSVIIKLYKIIQIITNFFKKFATYLVIVFFRRKILPYILFQSTVCIYITYISQMLKIIFCGIFCLHLCSKCIHICTTMISKKGNIYMNGKSDSMPKLYNNLNKVRSLDKTGFRQIILIARLYKFAYYFLNHGGIIGHSCHPGKKEFF